MSDHGNLTASIGRLTGPTDSMLEPYVTGAPSMTDDAYLAAGEEREILHGGDADLPLRRHVHLWTAPPKESVRTGSGD